MTFLFEATKHPKIFSKTYWGHFKLEEGTPLEEMLPIIENRNSFIKDYNIKSSKKQTQKIIDFFFNQQRVLPLDHTEFYVRHDKSIIIITSPYNGKDMTGFEEVGWIKIPPLYHSNATTYLFHLH
jgi:hypothetical protein